MTTVRSLCTETVECYCCQGDGVILHECSQYYTICPHCDGQGWAVEKDQL